MRSKVRVLHRRAHEETTISVGEYLESWLQGKASLRASTRLSYRGHLYCYLIPHLGHYRLSELRAHHVEQMYRQIVGDNPRRDRPVGAATLRRIHATLLSALNTAVRRGLIPRNPATTVELPRSVPTRAQAWTPAQARLFLDAIGGDHLYPLYRLLIMTGLRRGEAVGLRWCDLDLDHGLLTVHQQVVNVAGDLVIGPPKSQAGRRTLALDEETADALKLHALTTLDNNPEKPSAFVFTGPNSGPVSPVYVSRHFERLSRAHQVPVIRLHDLRHTSASLGLASGETLVEISRRLGHSSIGITADTYTHICLDTARESVDRLAEMLAHH